MAKGSNCNLIHSRRGQSMVEFALFLPLAALIVAGIFDLGRAFFASITITNAARVGARYGALHILNDSDSQGICNASITEADASGIVINYNDVTITCSSSVTCLSTGTPLAGCAADQPITVTVNYLYDDMVLKFFFPSGIPMQRQEIMLVP